ncbi:MAG: thioredoxin family protein [Planctomycetota bacterium]
MSQKFISNTFITAFIAIAVSVASTDAANVSWRTSVERAANESASSGKPMLIKFSTEWCGYCKKMSRETFSNRKVATHIASCFVPVAVDGDQNRALVQRLGIRSYPTTIVVSPKMEILTQIKGFRSARELSEELKGLCDHSTSGHPPQSNSISASRGKPSIFGDYCPVTPLESGKLAKGDKSFRLNHRGYELTFASDNFRKAFQANPKRYWPAIDGYCVVSAADESSLAMGKLNFGLLYLDRAWFFASPDKREKFRENPNYYYERLRQLQEQQSSEPVR